MTVPDPESVAAPLELRIEKLVSGGLGLGRHEGLVVLLPGVIPGERVRAEVLERRRDFARARPVEWLETDPARRTPPCPHAARCGGCAFQHAGGEHQAALKAGIVVDALERAGVTPERKPGIEGSPETGWRCRAVLHAGRTGRQGLLGFFESGSHRVVDVSECGQLAPGLGRLIGELREGYATWLGGAGIQEIVLACDGEDVQRAVELRARRGALPALGRQLRRGGLKGAGSIGVSEAVAGASYRRVVGEPILEHSVGDLAYRVHLRSFFQANRFLVERLVERVCAAVPLGHRVVDLYAGVGLFSLAIARRGQPVVAVENDALAVRAAVENVTRAGLEELRIVQGDAARELGGLPRDAAQTLVLDPPRTGAPAELLSEVAERSPERVVYVSCDPATLARDTRRLAQAGYALHELTVLDMFPTTAHVESVAVLQR